MKINFKTILILFLVALLGSGLGTFGMLSIYQHGLASSGNSSSKDVVINEVEYTNIEKTDFTKAVEKAFNTVVEIQCSTRSSVSSGFFFGGGTTESTSAGSGVIFSEDGYIVTNEHVIDGLTDESSLKIKLYTGETYQGKVSAMTRGPILPC